MSIRRRAVAQLGSALDWGSRGRRFKSGQPDPTNPLGTGGLSCSPVEAIPPCHLSAIYREASDPIMEASSSTASRCIPGSTEL